MIKRRSMRENVLRLSFEKALCPFTYKTRLERAAKIFSSSDIAKEIVARKGYPVV